MRSVLNCLTIRGKSFLCAGLAAILAGLALGRQPVTSVGVLLAVLPLLAALTAVRARYQLRCERTLSPARVPAGRPARVTLRLENASKLPTGLMLAEDSVPYPLGARPRYVLNGIERGGSRELSYQLRSDLRGRFTIGPLLIRISDVFGLTELTGAITTSASLTVTPRVLPLSGALTTGSWAGDGDGRTRVVATAGDDDVVPRPYRDGDELRRVHWRSTARHGELMVRREEQHWKNRAFLLLDTRRRAHAGSGATSSFEAAVAAAASIGVHLAQAGLGGALVSDTGPLAGPGMFQDVMLDLLSVIRPSEQLDFQRAVPALSASDGGLLIVVAGQLSAAAARQLAACRREGSQGLALLLDVASWARGSGPGAGPGDQNGRPGDSHDEPARRGAAPAGGRPAVRTARSQGTAEAAAAFRAAGWRVTCLTAGAGLDAAWRDLHRTGSGGLERIWRPAVTS
jgi:uncharacterized protein (DUF58 family)